MKSIRNTYFRAFFFFFLYYSDHQSSCTAVDRTSRCRFLCKRIGWSFDGFVGPVVVVAGIAPATEIEIFCKNTKFSQCARNKFIYYDPPRKCNKSYKNIIIMKTMQFFCCSTCLRFDVLPANAETLF